MIGQLAEIHADVYKDGAKKKLFHALIHLDEGKFLKPDFAYDKDNIVRAIVSIIIVVYNSNVRIVRFSTSLVMM